MNKNTDEKVINEDAAMDVLRVVNAQKFIRMMDEMPPTNPKAPELSLADINTLVHELR
jgi:hypothetical protein